MAKGPLVGIQVAKILMLGSDCPRDSDEHRLALVMPSEAPNKSADAAPVPENLTAIVVNSSRTPLARKSL